MRYKVSLNTGLKVSRLHHVFSVTTEMFFKFDRLSQFQKNWIVINLENFGELEVNKVALG